MFKLNRILRTLVFFTISSAMGSTYAATFSVTDRISAQSEIHYLSFNVGSELANDLTIDVLAFEGLNDNFFDPLSSSLPGPNAGDDQLNTYIRLFEGEVSHTTQVGANGNCGTTTVRAECTADGSTKIWDSYLSISRTLLTPGLYILALGAENMNLNDAVNGFNASAGDNWDGRYRVQFDGDVVLSSVPIPAAIWLMGSGLLGLMGLSRKSKAQVAA